MAAASSGVGSPWVGGGGTWPIMGVAAAHGVVLISHWSAAAQSVAAAQVAHQVAAAAAHHGVAAAHAVATRPHRVAAAQAVAVVGGSRRSMMAAHAMAAAHGQRQPATRTTHHAPFDLPRPGTRDMDHGPGCTRVEVGRCWAAPRPHKAC